MRRTDNFFHHLSNCRRLSQAGFTLVELMIATMVFSVILIIITSGVVHFSNDYYRGINSSTTQNAATNVLNNVTQTIQFSNITSYAKGNISGVGTYLCLANKEFIYNLGVENSGLFVFNDGGHCYSDSSFTGTAAWGQRQNLLQPHMRLADLNLSNTGLPVGTWDVGLTVAYGDDDLLCIPGASPGDCSGNTLLTNFSSPNLSCKPSAGSQFCDVVSLSTTVQVRIQ